MKVLRQNGKVRLIKSAGKYSVQAQVGWLWWKKWKNISFGPYYPMRPGISRFTVRKIAEGLYEGCCPGGEYREWHKHFKYGVERI